MDDLPMFHQHSRALQREFGTVALADRISAGLRRALG